MIIWNCTIVHRGIDRDTLPPGCDSPMRDAVGAAFTELTGVEAEGISSGWGQNYLPESDAAVLDGRMTTDRYHECWKVAESTLAALHVPEGDYFTPTRARYMAALSALAEALHAAELVPHD